MRRCCARLPTTFGAGLFLALLLGACSIPPSAHAGCGEHGYLVFRDVPKGDADAPLPAPIRACTGPTCSRDDLPPLAPESVKATPPAPEALLWETSDAPAMPDSDWMRRDGFRRPTHHPSSIFRPPR